MTSSGSFVEQIAATFSTGHVAPLLLLQRAGIDLPSAIKALLIDRAIGLLTMAALLLLGLPRLWNGLAHFGHQVIACVR